MTHFFNFCSFLCILIPDVSSENYVFFKLYTYTRCKSENYVFLKLNFHYDCRLCIIYGIGVGIIVLLLVLPLVHSEVTNNCVVEVLWNLHSLTFVVYRGKSHQVNHGWKTHIFVSFQFWKSNGRRKGIYIKYLTSNHFTENESLLWWTFPNRNKKLQVVFNINTRTT